MQKTIEFLKKEIVLVLSFLLCVVSAFFVKPSMNYISYIDFRTLVLLFCLMAVMAGLGSLGVFDNIAVALLKKADRTNKLYMVLVLLCFFSAMLITNDVALITFVPFTVVTLKMAEKTNKLIYIVVMETIAANLGSMLTPIGNPQNLYLFSYFNMKISDFLLSVLPYSAMSLLLLSAGAFFAGRDELKTVSSSPNKTLSKKPLLICIVLFVLCIMSVFRFIDYYILLAFVIVGIIFADRKIFKKIDYSLLLTFLFLFVFIGNLGNIEAISSFFEKVVTNREVVVGILASQVFSNVPACVLLSGFSDNAKALLIGVNLGGLGTLIASMASLISYKLIQKENVKSLRYISVFTVANVIFLAFEIGLWLIIK